MPENICMFTKTQKNRQKNTLDSRKNEIVIFDKTGAAN